MSTTSSPALHDLALTLFREILQPRELPQLPAPEVHLAALGIESIGVLRLMMACAQKLGVDLDGVSDLPTTRLTTVRDALRLFEVISAAAVRGARV